MKIRLHTETALLLTVVLFFSYFIPARASEESAISEAAAKIYEIFLGKPGFPVADDFLNKLYAECSAAAQVSVSGAMAAAVSSPSGNGDLNALAAGPGETVTYVLNTNTGKFHKERCGWVKKIAKENRLDCGCSKEALESAGYVACKSCKPD